MGSFSPQPYGRPSFDQKTIPGRLLLSISQPVWYVMAVFLIDSLLVAGIEILAADSRSPFVIYSSSSSWTMQIEQNRVPFSLGSPQPYNINYSIFKVISPTGENTGFSFSREDVRSLVRPTISIFHGDLKVGTFFFFVREHWGEPPLSHIRLSLMASRGQIVAHVLLTWLN